jgi:hypothetical protein
MLGIAFSAPLTGLAQATDDDGDKPSQLAVSTDLNGDGILDVVRAASPAGDPTGPAVLSISLGRGNGNTQPAATGPLLGAKPTSIVAGDFNQDGFEDIIVGDDDGRVSLFLGDGTGRLTPAGDVVHLGSVVSIVAADFNRDGILDLAISDSIGSSVTVLLGTGRGTFRQEWSFPLRMAGTSPHLATADFNGDHKPDLAVVYDDDAEDTYDVMLGDGQGHFVHAPNLGLVRDPNAYCTP